MLFVVLFGARERERVPARPVVVVVAVIRQRVALVPDDEARKVARAELVTLAALDQASAGAGDGRPAGF